MKENLVWPSFFDAHSAAMCVLQPSREDESIAEGLDADSVNML